jgi:hypothetical protein
VLVDAPASRSSEAARRPALSAIPETRLATISTAASEVFSMERFSIAWTPARVEL